jgi:uncharacterized membrane protein
MKNCKLMLLTTSFVLLLAFGASAADAPPLTFKFTKSDIPGATQTLPYGVNNAGITVGQYEKSGFFHGYMFVGKKVTTLDHPKGMAGSTLPNSLNSNSTPTVAGFYRNSGGNNVGFLYQNGKYKDIAGPAGAKQVQAYAINDKGAVVGNYTDSSNVVHGFLLKGKTYTTLDVPGSTATWASGINNSGAIVLFWMDSKNSIESSITKNNGKSYRTINVPGTGDSYASAINNAGDVVYQFYRINLSLGALLHKGKYYKFRYPKLPFTYASGINDKSTIAGGYARGSNFPPVFGFKATFK